LARFRGSPTARREGAVHEDRKRECGTIGDRADGPGAVYDEAQQALRERLEDPGLASQSVVVDLTEAVLYDSWPFPLLSEESQRLQSNGGRLVVVSGENPTVKPFVGDPSLPGCGGSTRSTTRWSSCSEICRASGTGLRKTAAQSSAPRLADARVASLRMAMEPWSYELAGRFDQDAFESEVLQGNPLGDPHVRPLRVYVPPGYDDDPGRRYPSVYVIQGLTGQVDAWWNRTAFRKNFPELVDELFASGDSPPCVLVFVDAWTSLGGSQFIDSPGTGRYHTYICEELVPWVDERYRTLAGAEHRGIAGKSSGGYGAMVNPMLRPDVFGGLATHAGDALFEMCYLPDFRKSVRSLRDHYEGSFEKFWEDFRSRPAFSKDSDYTLLNDWCMAACYSADEDGTVHLPYDTTTGELQPEVWERWLSWDPVRMVEGHADGLRSLRAIYIDAGKRDQYFLDLGAEAFRLELEAIGVTDVFFELFDATHTAIEYRYPLAIKYLAERLA
jgi:enterochelin esterase-like enzyme